MKFTYKKSGLGVLIMILLPLALTAQIKIGNLFQTELIQRSEWNPAAMQEATVQISLADAQFFYGNTGFVFNDALVSVPGTDSLEFSFDQLLSQLDDNNLLRADFEYSLLNFALNLEEQGLQLGLNFTSRSHSLVGYSRDMFALLIQGNGAFVDQTVEIGPEIHTINYNDLGLSVAKKIGDAFRVGARVHYLNGSFALRSSRDFASLYTSPEYYQLTLETDYEIQVSFPSARVLDSLGSGNVQPIPIRPDILFPSNHGFSLDASVLFKPTEALELSVGAQGLGFINWSDNARRIRSQGTANFEGYDASQQGNRPIINQLLNQNFGAVVEDLEDLYSLETEEESFRTALPRRYFAAGRFSPIKQLDLGATYQSEQFAGRAQSTLGLYGGVKFGHGFSLGVSYGNNSNYGSFLGVHSHLNLGPVQFYTSLDNIGAGFNPLNSRGVIARFGTNLIFGKQWKKKDKGEERVNTEL